MENSFFVFSENLKIELPRFHICTWDFNSSLSSLVEFGFEVDAKSITGKSKLELNIFVPWLNDKNEIKDLYNQLKDPSNSRFIFNDSITSTINLEATQTAGVIHKFAIRPELCIVPINPKIEGKVIGINIDLQFYKNTTANIYFRFWIELKKPYMSIRKIGINKETIIYDIKVNELRNIPEDHVIYFRDKYFAKIDNCFCFTILPNDYDLVFFENKALRNVRTIEHAAFNRYIGDEIGGEKIEKEQLSVVFNKKKKMLPHFLFFQYIQKSGLVRVNSH